MILFFDTTHLAQIGLIQFRTDTGRERLVRTWLIRSSTLFEVSLKSLPDSYHFMFKMHG